ncbi:MAG TPA: hypothetical protein DCG18_07720 [Richelia sp.]|nr:hypothetical protein [Richelia intracellularis]HAE06621.1 hypothetical protein [Richelia sp.]
MLKNRNKVITPDICFINSYTLRQLWAVIEENETSTLLKFGDAELVEQLLGQLQNKIVMSREEVNTINNYLNSKVSLIRDLAEGNSF